MTDKAARSANVGGGFWLSFGKGGKKLCRGGKKHHAIPAGVEVKIDGKEVTVKGAKGTLHHTVAGEIEAKVEGNEVIVTPSQRRKRKTARFTV